jgi:hypothetical protein
MKDYVIFNLCEHVPAGYPGFYDNRELTIYEQFKLGYKNREFREANDRWLNLLLLKNVQQLAKVLIESGSECDFTNWLRTKKALLVTGYPKGSLPRLEGDILTLKYSPKTRFLEVLIANIKEVSVANGLTSEDANGEKKP